MATTTKAIKPTETEITTEAPVAAEVNEVKEVSKEDIQRTIAVVRYNLNQVYLDSRRARPLFSKTKAEAEARYSASVKSLTEFAEAMTRL